jgi:hypothetical protein
MKRSGAVVVAFLLAGCQSVPQPTFDPFQGRATVPPPSLRAPAVTAPVDPYYPGRPLPGPGGPIAPGVTGAVPNSAAPPATFGSSATAPTGTAPAGVSPLPSGSPPRTGAPAFGTSLPAGTPALPTGTRPFTPQPAPYGQPMRAAPYSTPYSAPGAYTPGSYPAGAPITIPPDNTGDGSSERRPPALPARGVSIPREAIDGGDSGRFGASDEGRSPGRPLALRRTKTPLTLEELAAREEAQPASATRTEIAQAAPRREARPAPAPQLRAVDTLPPVATRVASLNRRSASETTRVARPVHDEGPQLIAASDALPEVTPWAPKEPTVRKALSTSRGETFAARAVQPATVPALKVVHADEVPASAEPQASEVVQAVHFEPVAEVPAPRKKIVLEASPKLSSFATDYTWLRGQLDYSAVDRRWKLRYIPIDGETDRYGGSVVLVDSPRLAPFQRGQWVEVRGRLARPGREETGYAPPYEVTSIAAQ